MYNNRHDCSYIKMMLCCVSVISKSQALSRSELYFYIKYNTNYILLTSENKVSICLLFPRDRDLI